MLTGRTTERGKRAAAAGARSARVRAPSARAHTAARGRRRRRAHGATPEDRAPRGEPSAQARPCAARRARRSRQALSTGLACRGAHQRARFRGPRGETGAGGPGVAADAPRRPAARSFRKGFEVPQRSPPAALQPGPATARARSAGRAPERHSARAPERRLARGPPHARRAPRPLRWSTQRWSALRYAQAARLSLSAAAGGHLARARGRGRRPYICTPSQRPTGTSTAFHWTRRAVATRGGERGGEGAEAGHRLPPY